MRFSMIGKVATAVKLGMQSMIDSLDWMDDESKSGAYAKIRDLVVNVAYPNFLVNDTALDAYYEPLAFSKNDGIYQMLDKLTAFRQFLQFKKLAVGVPVDRTDWGPAAPTMVNALYQVSCHKR